MQGFTKASWAMAICMTIPLINPSLAHASDCENLLKLPEAGQLECLDRELRDTKDTIRKLTNTIIRTLSSKPPKEGIFDKRWTKLLRAEANATITLAEVKCEKEFLEGGATSSEAIQRRSCELEILSDHELFLKTSYFKE